MLQNNELEKTIISCLIIDNKLIGKARGEIQPSYFYNKKFKYLYEEILMCYDTKGFADITVLKTFPIDEMSAICTFAPTISPFNKYLREFKGIAKKRELLKSIKQLESSLVNDNLSFEELKQQGLMSLNSIRTDTLCDERSSMQDIILDVLTALETKYNDFGKINKSWGIKWLDEKTGGINPSLTYLAARPSVGKTAFALQIAKDTAKQGMKVAIFSLEMDKVSLCNRLMCNFANINKNYFDKNCKIPEDIWREIGRATVEISKLPISIYDKAFNIEEIIAIAEEQRSKSGLDILILDYIQLCESINKFHSTNDRIVYISRQLKKYQQQTGISIIALSQFNREAEHKKIPTLANLRDSGALEQDANNVFFLHEECEDAEKQSDAKKTINLVIAKQREGERNIFIDLKFYGATQRFYEI